MNIYFNSHALFHIEIEHTSNTGIKRHQYINTASIHQHCINIHNPQHQEKGNKRRASRRNSGSLMSNGPAKQRRHSQDLSVILVEIIPNDGNGPEVTSQSRPLCHLARDNTQRSEWASVDVTVKTFVPSWSEIIHNDWNFPAKR